MTREQPSGPSFSAFALASLALVAFATVAATSGDRRSEWVLSEQRAKARLPSAHVEHTTPVGEAERPAAVSKQATRSLERLTIQTPGNPQSMARFTAPQVLMGTPELQSDATLPGLHLESAGIDALQKDARTDREHDQQG